MLTLSEFMLIALVSTATLVTLAFLLGGIIADWFES